jgi:hypothetical protein
VIPTERRRFKLRPFFEIGCFKVEREVATTQERENTEEEEEKNSRGSPLRVGDMHLKKKSVERHAGRGRRTSHARAKHTAERTTAPTRNPLEQFEVTALHPTLLPLANLAFHT